MGAEEFLPKRAKEKWVSVTDDAVRTTVELVNIIHENLGHLDSRIWVTWSHEMAILREMITQPPEWNPFPLIWYRQWL